MRPVIVAIALAVLSLAKPAQADWSDEVRDTYRRFAAAQNAHDLAKVRALLLDSPSFLWVSDGRSVWGVDATLERMGSFQAAEIWRVEPSLDRAVPVRVGEGSAFLHLPLRLVIGSRPEPDELKFLVSMLCVSTPTGWRIAALFTTSDKAE